jgi:hypothetical protein
MPTALSLAPATVACFTPVAAHRHYATAVTRTRHSLHMTPERRFFPVFTRKRGALQKCKRIGAESGEIVSDFW